MVWFLLLFALWWKDTLGSISPATCREPQLSMHLKQIGEKFHHSATVESIGQTGKGTNIWTVVISDSISKPRPLLRPQIKFVGNINGFSGPSCFILLKLIEYLLEGELEGRAEVRRILATAQVHILPNLNPDGYVKSIPGSCDGAEGRLNGIGVDLNRNFPRPFDDIEEEDGRFAAETEALMSLMANNDFLLSISLFSGAIVVTYPFDAPPAKKKAKVHLTLDNDVFEHLASTYVDASQFYDLDDSVCPLLEKVFHHGMINGAEWAPVYGTMQDYNYMRGTLELMVGVSCCRNENRTQILDHMWERNKQSLMEMMKEANYGLRGQVIHGETLEPIQGVKLNKIPQHELETQRPSMEFTTNARGEFWRLAIPGNYFLSVFYEGFESELIFFNVNMRNHTVLLIKLRPFKEIEEEIDQNHFNDFTTTTTLKENRISSTQQTALNEANERNTAGLVKTIGVESRGCLNCYCWTFQLLVIILFSIIS